MTTGTAPGNHRPPPARLVIRAPRPEDADALNAMASLPGVRHGTGFMPYPPLAETQAWLATPNPGGVRLVAVLDGTVVGQADITRSTRRRAHCGTLGIYVHDGFVGRGIGTALMADLMDAADNWLDIRRLELTVFTGNAAAIALYRRFGFVEEGVLRGYMVRDGAYTDCLTMARLRGI